MLAILAMCGWPPGRKDFFTLCFVGSIAVMCPAFRRGTRPLALMRSVDRTLIILAGSRCPMTSDRFRSIRRLTDIAITRFHPRISAVPARGARMGRRRLGMEQIVIRRLPRHR